MDRRQFVLTPAAILGSSAVAAQAKPAAGTKDSPKIATSGAAGLYRRALVEKDGVFGIYDLPYLTASPHQPNVDDYIDHMVHALNICGEDHVGIGSDQSIQPFDTSPAGLKEFQDMEAHRRAAGVAAPEEDRPVYVEGLNVPNRCEVIADRLLKHGYSARVTEKVLGANFVRVFTEIWS